MSEWECEACGENFSAGAGEENPEIHLCPTCRAWGGPSDEEGE